MRTSTEFTRELNDSELENFHGGSCEITIIRNGNGQVIGIKTIGQCDGIVINLNPQ